MRCPVPWCGDPASLKRTPEGRLMYYCNRCGNWFPDPDFHDAIRIAENQNQRILSSGKTPIRVPPRWNIVFYICKNQCDGITHTYLELKRGPLFIRVSLPPNAEPEVSCRRVNNNTKGEYLITVDLFPSFSGMSGESKF